MAIAVAVDPIGRLTGLVDGDQGDRRWRSGHQPEAASRSTPSSSSRSRSHVPHASSPTPPASATGAPCCAATTATLATAPPKVGTNASASREVLDVAPTDEVDEASPRQSVVMGCGTLSSPTACASTSTRSSSARRPVFYHSSPLRRAILSCTSTECRRAQMTGSPFSSSTGGIAPDLPGFGRSSKSGHLDYTMAGHADFLERLLEHARHRADQARGPRLGRGGGTGARTTRSRPGRAPRALRRGSAARWLHVASPRSAVAQTSDRRARDGVGLAPDACPRHAECVGAARGVDQGAPERGVGPVRPRHPARDPAPAS